MKAKKDLTKQISLYKNQLLELLKTWYYYQTEVLQRINFNYENLFGDIESEIESKEKNAKALERKYQMLTSKMERGEKITRKSVEFIDGLLDKEKKRDVNFQHRSSYKSKFSNFRNTTNNGMLDTKYNDQYDLSYLYHQIVKRLHPDIIGETTTFRTFWDNVQICYSKKDIERLKMFYFILCRDHKNNMEEIHFNENDLHNDVEELKNFIEKQKQDIDDLKTQEPFCFEDKLADQNWIIERKNLLRNKLVQINKRIMHNNRLIRAVNVVDDSSRNR
jgi:archaellum component FlaC